MTTTTQQLRTTVHVGLPSAELAELVAIVATHYEGATVTPAHGIWQGSTEPAAVVTLIHPDSPSWSVRTDALCRHLCDALRQSCVLVTTEPVAAHTYAARAIHALAEAY